MSETSQRLLLSRTLLQCGGTHYTCCIMSAALLSKSCSNNRSISRSGGMAAWREMPTITYISLAELSARYTNVHVSEPGVPNIGSS
jgi:hypothetical protein